MGSRQPSLRLFRLVLALAALAPGWAFAHPANIPIVRAKVAVDGSIELTVTFDVLAFVLDQTPQIVLDAPMNALLEGPQPDLQVRLIAAKKRFLEGFGIGDNSGVIDSITLPSAAEVHELSEGQLPRLPVMATATLRCHLKLGVDKVSFHFPDVMGTVVVTTEFPYQEPVTESVDPGDSSPVLSVPTQAQVDALAASMLPHKVAAPKAEASPGETEAKRAIQKQYNAWSKAYMAHDVDTLIAILSPAYTLKTAQGTLINYPEYAAMLKLRKQKHSDTTRYSTEILRITLRDGVAAIWSRETTTDPGLNQTTGKAEPVSYQHDYIDLWVYTNKKWLLKGTVTQKEQRLPATK